MRSAERTLLDVPQYGGRLLLRLAPLLVILVLVILVLVIPSCGIILAQRSNSGNSQVTIRPTNSIPTDMTPPLTGGPNDPIFQQRRLRQLNAAQHKAMVSDADKLLKLVTELNEEVGNTTPTSLTPDQLRMVAEIEKLAHSVKDKMKNSVQGGPGFLDSGPPLYTQPSRR